MLCTRVLVCSFVIVQPLGLSACVASPVRELWPPKPGEPRHQIDVVYWDWHTVIVVPPKESDGPSRQGEASYAEWGFCEKGWYIEGRQGFTGIFRALCWPTRSGVGCRLVASPYWKRYPGRNIERWTFFLSDAGREKMLAALESERGPPLDRFTRWYAGNSAYHFFFMCHHFTLDALREAGLPVRPWWGFAGWMTAMQLNRVRRFHEEEGLYAGTVFSEGGT